jgi:hypothetical protein
MPCFEELRRGCDDSSVHTVANSKGWASPWKRQPVRTT